MNKRVLNISLFLLLASTGNVLAQQGIGTNTPHRSAALHVDSQNKGLLIPRMNLTHSQTNGITAPITYPAQGLLVYNNQSYPVNATGQDVLVPEGFYYFDGTNWNPISKSYLENSSYTTILGTGTSSDPYKINLVHASLTEYGVVKIGNNIDVSDGVISVNFPPNTIDTNTTTTVSTAQSYITVESSHTVGNPTSPLQTVNYEIGVDPATETSLGVVAPGKGLAIDNGILSVDISTIENKGNLTSTEGDESITVTNGTGATLVNTNIKVSDLGISTGKLAEGAVTSIKIADGTIETIDIKDRAVTPAKVEAGTNNTVLSTDASGNVVWVDKSTLDTDTIYSAGSGISLDGTQFSVPVTTTGNGNVLTGVTATATGLEFTKQPFAATDTRTKVEAIANRPITVTSNAFTVGEENTYTLDLKVGSGLEVESDGTLKVAFNDTDNQTITDLSLNGTQLSITLERGGDPVTVDLTALTNTTKLGNGTNTTMSGNGSATTPYTVNVATGSGTTLGVVRQADTAPSVTVTNGVLAVDPANVAITNALSSSGNQMSSTVNGGTAQTASIINTNVLSLNGDNHLVSTINGIPSSALDLSAAIQGVQKTTTVKAGTNTTVTPATPNATGNTEYEVSVATATASALGVVKPGTGLTVDTDGTLNATQATVTNTVTGHKIADVTTSAGTTAINETVTSLSQGENGISYSDENGTNAVKAIVVSNDANNLVKTGTDFGAFLAKADIQTSQIKYEVIDGENTAAELDDTSTDDLKRYKVNVDKAEAQVGATAGTLGVVKPSNQFEIAPDGHLKIKYATPEFFYMPALLIPLSGQTNAEGFLSLDLHGKYQERFNTPAVVSADSELANLSSLVVPINMLDIYITYYDEQVLENVSIDRDGKMWYKVKANYNYTEASFMNVVFKVRTTPKP